MKYLIILLSMFLLIGTCCKKVDAVPYYNNAKGDTTVTPSGPVSEYIPGEVLVKFKKGVVDNVAMARVKGQIKKKTRTKSMIRAGNPGYYILKVSNVPDAVIKLKQSSNVEWATPNIIVKKQQAPSDPFYNQLWGMPNINVDDVWTSGNTGSQSVLIGVIDEGIMTFHEDLCGQVWVNPYDPVDGIDNDGNGYVDDVNGWDFAFNDNTVFDNIDFHGTHVAGTIGAKENNLGVVGVAPRTTIISGKFLNQWGGTLDAAIQAIDYFTDLKIRHKLNIPATSNSWGGFGYYPPLEEAISRANAADILFVCAAGNNGMDMDQVARDYPGQNFLPASIKLPNVITVSAINSSEQLASFSNYGDTLADLAAPGVDILSTYADTGRIGDRYVAISGTSMATPHVSGAVALYKAKFPTATAAQIKAALLNAVRVIPSLVGKVKTNGTLDVSFLSGGYTSPAYVQRSCVRYLTDTIPPSAPANLRIGAILSPNSVRLKFTPSTDNNPLNRLFYYYLELEDSIGTNLQDLQYPAEPGSVTWEGELDMDITYGRSLYVRLYALDQYYNRSVLASNRILVNSNPDKVTVPPITWYSYSMKYGGAGSTNIQICSTNVSKTYYSTLDTLVYGTTLYSAPHVDSFAATGYYGYGYAMVTTINSYLPPSYDVPYERGFISYVDTGFCRQFGGNPGTVTPPPPPPDLVWYTHNLRYSASEAHAACTATTTSQYYSTASSINNGNVVIYTDSANRVVAPNGWYSKDTSYYKISSGGLLSSSSGCSSVAPPPPPPSGTLSVVANGSYTSTKLHVISWNMTVSNATVTKAEVYYRKGSSGTWFLQTTNESGNTSGTWTNPTKQRPGKYQYYVKGYASGGLVSNSNIVQLNGTNK